MKKYIMLFNLEGRDEKKRGFNFLKIVPQAKLEKYGIIGSTPENREKVYSTFHSLWVPEELYLMAWTHFEYKGIKSGISTLEDGIEYFEMMRNDDEFIQFI